MGAREATHSLLRESVATLCRRGRLRDALNLLHRPFAPPDYLTFTALIQACARARALPEAKLVHTYLFPFLPTYPKETLTIAHNHLIRMYDKCGAPLLALGVFKSMQTRTPVSYNLMIAAHARAGHSSLAFQLLMDMHLHHLRPDKFSFISVISSCVKSTCLDEGKMAHIFLVFEGLDHVGDIGNALITFYGTCACLDDALRTLEMMPKRSVVSWNAVFAVCCQHGHVDVAFQLYAKMQNEGIHPNSVSFITLLTACATLAKLDEGKKLHALIQISRLKLDVVLVTALMDMYSKCGDFDATLKVFTEVPSGNMGSQMTLIAARLKHGYDKELFCQLCKQGIEGNHGSHRILLEVCTSSGNLTDGKLLDACFVDNPDDTDNAILYALESMHNCSGSLEDVFAVSNKTCIRDTVSWNALISANSQHGNSNKALNLFKQMLLQGVKPTENTFISVLSACSHTGLLNEGLLYYDYMCRECRCVPLAQHNTCMIDLLGRAGRLEEAEDFADQMPLQPGVLEWMALVSACRVHHYMDQARCAAHQALELDPLVIGAYIALSNILVAVYRWDDDTEYD